MSTVMLIRKQAKRDDLPITWRETYPVIIEKQTKKTKKQIGALIFLTSMFTFCFRPWGDAQRQTRSGPRQRTLGGVAELPFAYVVERHDGEEFLF